MLMTCIFICTSAVALNMTYVTTYWSSTISAQAGGPPIVTCISIADAVNAVRTFNCVTRNTVNWEYTREDELRE